MWPCAGPRGGTTVAVVFLFFTAASIDGRYGSLIARLYVSNSSAADGAHYRRTDASNKFGDWYGAGVTFKGMTN